MRSLPLAVKVAVGLALFQAAATAMFAIVGVENFAYINVVDAVLLAGLGVATMKRHLWAAYGLVGYSAFDVIVKYAIGRPAWVIAFVVYLVGAILLHRTRHIAPSLKQLNVPTATAAAAIWVAGRLLVRLQLGLFDLMRDGLPVSDTVALAQSAINIAWGIAVCWYVARTTTWPFETVLLTALLAVPFGVVEVFVTPTTPIEFVAGAARSVAMGLVGFELARVGGRRDVPEPIIHRSSAA